MSSVLDIAKSLNRSYKNNNLTMLGDVLPEYKRLKSSNLGITYPTYGGIPLNSIVTFSGVSASGKSLMAYAVMADYQREYPDRMCIAVDIENTLGAQLPFFVKMTGLDTSKLTVIRPNGFSAEQIAEMIRELLLKSDDVGMIVVDSLSAMVSTDDLKNGIEKDSGMRASIAKTLGKFFRIVNPIIAEKETTMICINHVRESKARNGAVIYSEPGGHAVSFYPNMRLRFGRLTYVQNDKYDLAKGDDATGFQLKYTIVKSKVSPKDRGGGKITFDNETGMDYMLDNLNIAIDFGFIDRPNLQTYIPINLETGEYYVDEENSTDENTEYLKFRGRAACIEYFKTHDKFASEYFDMLSNYMSNMKKNISLLDEEDVEAIEAEEKATIDC
jgi:recA bacterial DNA recombination protein